MKTYEEICENLLDASHKESFACAQIITDILLNSLPIKACSFYSYYAETEYLSLRAQSGFAYKDYTSFELPLNTIAGRSVLSAEPIQSFDLSLENGYRDLHLIKKYQLDNIIAVPIPAGKECVESLSGSFCQKHIGVVCIYPTEQIDLDLLVKITKLVGKVYSYSVIQDRIGLRKTIVNNSLRAKDLNSFLHKVLWLLSESWGIEASSVFINDPRNDLLTMRATTGVDCNLKLFERCYRTDETSYNTVLCFNTESIITRINDPKKRHKYPEKISNSFKSIVYLPIYEPSGKGVNGENHISGVLRCVNRVVERKGISEVCHHGWEDASILLFVAEVIGVISHLFKRSDEISLNFERAMHGINKPIHTAKVRIRSTQKYMSSQNLLKAPFDNFIKDSISYLDALEWQVRKHALRDNYKKIRTQEVKLFGQVLSKMLSFMDEIHKTYNVKHLHRNKIDYDHMPTVRGDPKALQVVFRNIIENALKYTGRDKKCDISLSWEQDKDFLNISISDNGIGIQDKDSLRIFDEGFRSLDAMRIEPTGTGIGLADSREIMREMGGDIELSHNENPTTFIVKIEKYRSNK